MLHLPQLEALVHPGLQLLFESVHLVILLLHEFCLRGEDLLVSRLQIVRSLLFLQLVGPHLDLVGVLVILLLSQVGLNLP